MSRSLAPLGLLALLTACGGEPITLDLNFPSQETFLYSEQARVMAFAVSPARLGDCPRLLAEVGAGSTSENPAIDTGLVPVCRYRGGGVTVDDSTEGPMAWVAVVEDASNTPLLTGCTIAEIYPEAPEILIHLFMTDEYRDAATGPLSCSSVEDKCAAGCL